MSLLTLQQQLRDVERQQSRKGERVKRAVTKFNDLERKKRLLKRKIEKTITKLEKLGDVSLPANVIKKIERTINQERWMERIVEKRFNSESEHGPGSKKWKNLRAGTIARRGSAHPILYDTGVMFENTVRAAQNTFKFRGVSWNVSRVPVSYAKYAHKARPFFNSPNKKELAPVMKRATQLARAELRRIARAG